MATVEWRATIRGHRPSVLMALAFLGVLGGTVLLGVFGVSASRRVGQLTRESMHTSTAVLADKIVRKVEKRIIDQDRVLFELVDLKDLDDFKVFWNRLTTMSSLVEGALVLDSAYRILHYASKEQPRERAHFISLFSSQILPRLELARLPVGYHKHLHVSLGGRDYLISYMVLRQRSERFLVALKINLDYLRRWMLREELTGLARRYVAAVVDQDGRLVYGHRPPKSLAPHQVERRFAATLYRWRLVLAPRAAARLEAHAARRDRISLILLFASLATTLLGLGGLVWALRRERLVAKLKGDFVSTVTHELKTPLSLIRMYGELLAVDRPDARARRPEYAAVLSREIEKLSRLIDNVLDLSRLEHGLRAHQILRVDLARLAQDVLAELESPARAAGVSLALSRDSEPPFEAEVDEDGVRVALQNLVDNAIKYGATEVEVSLERSPTHIWVRVADNGPGVDPMERERLFERFYRGESATRGRERGSGIGLSLVRLVADAHGGTVTVSDRPGGGAVFTLRLPTRTRVRSSGFRALRKLVSASHRRSTAPASTQAGGLHSGEDETA